MTEQPVRLCPAHLALDSRTVACCRPVHHDGWHKEATTATAVVWKMDPSAEVLAAAADRAALRDQLQKVQRYARMLLDDNQRMYPAFNAACRWVEASSTPGCPAQVVATADMTAAVQALPEAPRPLTWALPDAPGPDVTHLATPSGLILERAAGAWCHRERGRLWSWPELLAEFRTLTDVTSSANQSRPAPNLRFPTGRPGWLGTGQPWPCGTCGREVDDESLHDCQPRASEQQEGAAAG